MEKHARQPRLGRYVFGKPDLFVALICAIGLLAFAYASHVSAQGTVVVWGDNQFSQYDVPIDLCNVSAIAAGNTHCLALKDDGTVISWAGLKAFGSYVPPDLGDVIAISAGGLHSLALRADGTVVGWGYNDSGQFNPPVDQNNDIIAIAAGFLLNLALKTDGTVISWGSIYSLCCSSLPTDLTDVIAITAGYDHALALKADGTVVAWGQNDVGQCDVPPDLNDVIDISSGAYHNLALKSNGKVVAWGQNIDGQCYVPEDLNDVIAIAGGYCHSLALKKEGTVVAWGGNYFGAYNPLDIPGNLDGVIAIAADGGYSMALVDNGNTNPAYDEARVRYILADLTCGGPVGYYRNKPDNVNAVEAVKRWDANVRVTNGNEFQRIWIGDEGIYIVYAGTQTIIDGMDVHLTTDLNLPPQASDDFANTNEDTPVTIEVLTNDSDPDGDALTVTDVVSPAYGSALINPDGTVTYTPALDFNGTDSFAYGISDGREGTAVALVTISVIAVNDPPEPGTITAPLEPVDVTGEVIASATFSDPDQNDTHTAVWDWGDGSTTVGALDEVTGLVTGSHTYNQAGVYTVTLTVTDAAQATGTSIFEYVVVYDPEMGFVTGGGWIDSPAGAFIADPAMTGKASFGFVARYKKGANVPTGQTEFQFKAGGLNFKSSSYDWLVVAGVRAQFKGVGQIAGWSGEYGFMLTAIDGDLLGGAQPDKFRIKIVDKATGEIVYDNQLDVSDGADPSTALGGGSIVIHK